VPRLGFGTRPANDLLCRNFAAVRQHKLEGKIMLYWAAVFLIIGLLAGALGFGGLVAGTAVSIAKILFFVFLVLFVVSLLMGRKPVV
jgi:uncharacterized membrane protein YtjA (UPF0391 family)